MLFSTSRISSHPPLTVYSPLCYDTRSSISLNSPAPAGPTASSFWSRATARGIELLAACVAYEQRIGHTEAEEHAALVERLRQEGGA
ncbi:MAG TPA: hypothetical protein VFS21_06150 [Roseiflexaceae bacterium]|nr:hypothetical protein [Roseiflexaceae bacterium]